MKRSDFSCTLIPSKILRQCYFSSVRSPDVLSALKSVAARCFRLPSANERCLQLSGVTLSSPMTFFMAFLRIAVTFEEKGKLGLLIKRQNKSFPIRSHSLREMFKPLPRYISNQESLLTNGLFSLHLLYTFSRLKIT